MTPPRWLQRLTVVGAVSFLGAVDTQAHRLDECLQATLISVEPGRIGVEVSLTPGVEMVDWILPVIDPDRDGIVSATEGAAYAGRVRTNLVLMVDSRLRSLTFKDARFPGIAEMKEGLGVVRLHFTADIAGLGMGAHRLDFQNAYLTNHSVYQANALMPESSAVTLGRSERDLLQTRLGFDFTLAPDDGMVAPARAGSSSRRAAGLALAAGAAVLFWCCFRSWRRSGRRR